jgi:predicted CopG family antitoxin
MAKTVYKPLGIHEDTYKKLVDKIEELRPTIFKGKKNVSFDEVINELLK